MQLNKCLQCGSKKAKRLFCGYLCFARFAVKNGMWGAKWSPKLYRKTAAQVENKRAARHAIMRDFKKS